jgi:exopolysaccharide biosynthesis polyprenyl glycosylphosphotransferase
MNFVDISLAAPATVGPTHSVQSIGRDGLNHRRALLRRAMIISEPFLDATAIIAAMDLTAFAEVTMPSLGGQPAWVSHSSPDAALLVFLTIFVLGLLERAGAYRPVRSLLHIRETATLLAVTTAVTGLLLAVWLLGVTPLPLIQIPVFGASLFVLMLLEKSCMHFLCRVLHRRGMTPKPVAIVGAGLACRRIYSALVNSPRLGMWPAMVINPLGTKSREETVAESSYSVKQSAVVLAEQLDCQRLIAAGIEKLILMANSFNHEQTQEILRRAAACGLEAEVCIGDDVAADGPVEFTDIDGIMVWRPFQTDYQHVDQALKRIVDMVGAAALLILFAPVMLVVAAAIKLTSPGPIFFRQVRVARYGHCFSMLKFRSMHSHSCGDGLSPTSGSDQRISSVGRVLRKASLDELPQLINVLRGDMSLVGPRPEMPFIVKEYTPLQLRRLEVTPGITGLWQISGHRKHQIHDNMQYDLYYVRHRSLFLDLAILIHTVFFAIKGI